jgi:hypothetical protein
LNENLVDGENEMANIAKKAGYVQAKVAEGAGVWSRQFLEASGVYLNLYKDASRKSIQETVDLRQIVLEETVIGGVSEISIVGAGKELVRIKAYGSEETKIWLRCIKAIQSNENEPNSYHTSSSDKGMVVIGTDQITECDYNEL